MIPPRSSVRPLFRAYLPENFDPSGIPARHRAGAGWLASRIYVGHHLRGEDADDFLPLHAKRCLKPILGEHYVSVVGELQDAGVVERDNEWRVGEKAIGYRLGPRFRHRRHAEHLLTSVPIAGAIARKRTADDAASDWPAYRHLRAWLDRLDIDPSYPRDRLPPALIGNRDWFYRVCEYGRFHSALTNLPREYRHLLHYKGEPLWQVDTSCSQPYLLSLSISGKEPVGYDEFPRKQRPPKGTDAGETSPPTPQETPEHHPKTIWFRIDK